MKPTNFLFATALQAAVASALFAGSFEPEARADARGEGDHPIAMLDVYRSQNEDASGLIGRFLPDDVALSSASEKILRTNECSKLFTAQNVPAALHREEVLSDKRGNHRRVEFDVTRRLSAHLADVEALKRCCQNHPGACTSRYVDSVLFGELFDRTESLSRQAFRETRGEKFFAFTVAPLPFHDEQASRCDKKASWKSSVPKSEAGLYVVGISSPQDTLSLKSARSGALRDAREQAAALIMNRFGAQKSAVESAMGFVALSAQDFRTLKDMAKNLATNVGPECWDGQSSPIAGTTMSVLALVPHSLLDEAMRSARVFFMARTAQAVESTLGQTLSELPKLLEGTGVSSVHISLPEDKTAPTDDQMQPSNHRRSLWLAERLVAAWMKSKVGGLQATSALDEVDDAETRTMENDSTTSPSKKRPHLSNKAPQNLAQTALVTTALHASAPPGFLTIAMALRLPEDAGRTKVIPLLNATIPASVFPDGSDAKAPPVKIVMDMKPDGTVCPYSFANLSLSTTRHLYVQLWSLSGKNCDEALLLHPSKNCESGYVTPGKPLDLGAVWVVPTEGSRRECLLAIGATTKDVLGKLENFRGCKMGKIRTEKLLDMGKLLSAKGELFIDRVEYVISSDATDCGGDGQTMTPKAKRQAQQEAYRELTQTPICR